MKPTQEQIAALVERLRHNSPSHVDADIWMQDAADMLEQLAAERGKVAGVRVKKWNGHKSMYQYRTYPIGGYNGKRESVFLERDEFGCRVQIAKCAFPDEAQAALQTDYEARILAALEPAPDARSYADGVRDAAKVADYYAEMDYGAMHYPEEGAIAAGGTAHQIRQDIRALLTEKPHD